GRQPQHDQGSSESADQSGSHQTTWRGPRLVVRPCVRAPPDRRRAVTSACAIGQDVGRRRRMSSEWTSVEMARPERFELPTTWFEARYSIQLSYGRAALASGEL